MGKYNKTLVNEMSRWVEEHGLIEYGGALFKDFCKVFSIDNKTFYHWMDKPEFKESITKAREVFKQKASHELSTSLFEVARGYSREETETEYIPNAKGEATIKKMKKKTVYYQPNVAAAIFLLTNIDPDHYQNKQRADVAIKKQEDDKPLTLEEVNKELERLRKFDIEDEDKEEAQEE